MDHEEDIPLADEVVQDLNSLSFYCILPSLWGTAIDFVLPLFICNLFLKTVIRFVTEGHIAIDILTIAIGFACLVTQLRDEVTLLLIVCIHSVIGSALVVFIRRKTFVWIYALSVLILNETICFYASKHMRIRTHVMLLLMKFVSWKDLSDDVNRFRQLVSCLSYASHPASVCLGSWHHPITSQSTGQYSKSLICVVKASLLLVASNCLIQYFVTEYAEPLISFNLYDLIPETVATILHKLLICYFVALQFRCSHYFICYMTEASFLFWGLDQRVAKPEQIEAPHSLVDVVVCWNIPFHNWIRKHVFLPLKQKLGAASAIFLTYCISSLMHGFNFQICSVLLCLACLTLVEHLLRQKLSVIFNACIAARKCPQNCGHQNKNQFVVNICFTLLAVAHLSFLGSAFDGREDSSYMQNVLSVWYSLGFYSPVLGIVTALFYFSLRT